MSVEIEFLPKSYISEVPAGGGFFPFGRDGEVPYIVEYEGQELDIEVFFNNWMAQLNKFPIYTLFAYAKVDEEEIDNTFSSLISESKTLLKVTPLTKDLAASFSTFVSFLSFMLSPPAFYTI